MAQFTKPWLFCDLAARVLLYAFGVPAIVTAVQVIILQAIFVIQHGLLVIKTGGIRRFFLSAAGISAVALALVLAAVPALILLAAASALHATLAPLRV